jgi:sortase A
LLAGLIAVGIWAWSYVRLAVFQKWANHELDHRTKGRSAAISPPPSTPRGLAVPSIQNGALIGRLAIPRLNMRAVVREGAGQDTLDVALGHIPGTALPGQPGNAGIAGHRDTLFRDLRHIQKNDVIEFQTLDGSYNYQVETTGIVKPRDVGVLAASQHPEMTLVTCYPFYYVGSAPDRFIVKARLVEPPTAPAAPPPPAAQPATRRTIRRVNFQVSKNLSREVLPGIRLGLSSADAARHRASVWVFVTPERRRISLKNQAAHQAVFFHGHDDGKRRELMITRVSATTVSGYVLLLGSARARPAAQPLRDP